MEEDEQTITYPVFKIDSEIRKYYKSCINDGDGNTMVDSLKETLNKLGGWPVLEGDRWNGTNASFKWYDMVLKMEEMGFYQHSLSIISYYIGYDLENKEKKQLYLNMPLSDLPWVSTSEVVTSDLGWKYVSEKISEYFGPNVDVLKRDMNETRMLESDIMNAMNQASFYRYPYIGPLVAAVDNTIFDDRMTTIKSSRINTTLGNVFSSLTNLTSIQEIFSN